MTRIKNLEKIEIIKKYQSMVDHVNQLEETLISASNSARRIHDLARVIKMPDADEQTFKEFKSSINETRSLLNKWINASSGIGTDIGKLETLWGLNEGDLDY